MKEQTKNMFEQLQQVADLKEQLNRVLNELNEGRVCQSDFKSLIVEFIVVAANRGVSLHWKDLDDRGIEEHESLFEFLDGHIVNSYTNERTGEVVELYSFDHGPAKVTFAMDQHGVIHSPSAYIDLVNAITDGKE